MEFDDERTAREKDEPAAREKSVLRSRLLRARAALDPADRAVAGEALRVRALAVPELARARAVACYVSVGREPDTVGLLAAWRERGVRVLVPVLRADADLDWAEYTSPGCLRPAGRGLLEPAAPRLGLDALTSVDALVVPALAVDRRGRRLGRGGGSYDRALARVPPGRFVAALVYDTEVLDRVPAAAHDQPVTAAVTPGRLLRFDTR